MEFVLEAHDTYKTHVESDGAGLFSEDVPRHQKPVRLYWTDIWDDDVVGLCVEVCTIYRRVRTDCELYNTTKHKPTVFKGLKG